MPIGFVPIYWKRSKDHETFLRHMADMNLKQNTFILKIYERAGKNNVSHAYTGPFTLYDENDVQNLINFSLNSSTSSSKLNMVDKKSLICNYEG